MSKFNGTKEKCEAIFNSYNKRCVRSIGGIICTLTSPFKYNGQDERYDMELEEQRENQKLIVDAFNTINECDLLPSELLSQRNEMLEMLEKVLSLKSLIEYGDEMVNEQNISEAKALGDMIQGIEQLINKATKP